MITPIGKAADRSVALFYMDYAGQQKRASKWYFFIITPA